MKAKKNYISVEPETTQEKLVSREEFQFWPPVAYPTTREEWVITFPLQFAEEIYRSFKKKLAKAGYDYDDAIQEAMEVVIHCADHYCTVCRETKFSTYACTAIKNRFINLLRQANAVSRPNDLEEFEEDYITNEIDDDGYFSEEFEEATIAKIEGFASLEDRVFYKDMLRLLYSRLSLDERELLQDLIRGSSQALMAERRGLTVGCVNGRIRKLRARCMGIISQEKYKEEMVL